MGERQFASQMTKQSPAQNPVTSQVVVTCPHCRGELTAAADAVCCESCGCEFGMTDGIPVLRQNAETYYGEFPQDDMHRLLEAAREDVETTVGDYLRDQDAPPRLGEYILGRGRAGWQYLLPLDRDSVVLDLGCGWGTLAWSLAQFCGHVVACDSTLERMQLLGIRRKNDQLDNLQLVCAGDCQYLPFPDNSFNAVVVNGVLEWVPGGLPGDPRQVQVEFLREIRRVLRPDGCLFLGIENRYAWKTWGMNADGHTGLRFVPWLPRPLAHLYSKMNGQGSYRNYLYGPGQYRRLLDECGFADTQFYVPAPGYHHPVQMIDFEDSAQLEAAFTRAESTPFRRFRQKVKGYLSARFPDAFGMIASDQKRDSFLQRVLDHVRQQSGDAASDGPVRFSYRMNGEMGIVTVISRSPGTPYILKLPIHQRGLEELRSEFRILQQVREPGHPLTDRADLFARVVSLGEFGRQEYFACSMLPGVSGDRIPAASDRFDCVVRQAATFLTALHQQSPDQQVSLAELVEPARAAVLTLAADADQRDAVNRVADKVLQRFDASFAGAVWSHGDSKPANFMFDPKSADLTGVIDWGVGFQPELPGYDLSFLIVSSEAARGGTSLTDELRRQYEGGCPSGRMELLDQFEQATGVSLRGECYHDLIGYQWLKRLAPLAGEFESMRFNVRYLSSMFDVVSR